MYDSIAQDSHENILKYVLHICCLICMKYTLLYRPLNMEVGPININTHAHTRKLFILLCRVPKCPKLSII